MMKRSLLFLLIVSAVACGERATAPGTNTSTAAASEYVQPHDTTTISTTAAPESSTLGTPPVTATAPPPAATTAPPPATATAPVTTTKKKVEQKVVSLASTIIDASKFSDPKIQETYRKAKQVADRLDQMYCYCHCKENPGLKHKSLVTCFQTNHAAECGICLNEAEQAWLDWKDDLPVETTLKSIDLLYNNGNPPPGGHTH